MRINVYSQELTDEVIELDKVSYTGRIYKAAQLVLHSSERLHHPPEDDDRSAVTFWLPGSPERCESMAKAFERIASVFRGQGVPGRVDSRVEQLVEAVGRWYSRAGHDMGDDLNQVANAYVRLQAGTGQATEARNESPAALVTPPGVMLFSETLEPDQETMDAFERAGREKLIRETAEAWKARPEIETTREISTSGYVAVLPDPVADDARRAYDNRYHKIRAEVGFDAWLKAYRHFVSLEVEAVKGSDIEAKAKEIEAQLWDGPVGPTSHVPGA